MGDDKYRPPSVNETPWLITTHDNNNGKLLEKQTFCCMSPMSPANKTYVTKIVELHGKYIIASSQGWLILREREDPTMYSLWNPVTLQSFHLPPLVDPPAERRRGSIFISTPNEGDEEANQEFVLLMFFKGLVFYCRPTARDGCRWAEQSLKHDDQSVTIDKVATVNNGDIYAIAEYNVGNNGGYKSMIVRMKVVVANDGLTSILFEPSILELPYRDKKYYVPSYPARATYLVEASGDLHLVYMVMRNHDNYENFDIFKAFVWRLDSSQMKWIELESLGNRAFLLGHSSGSTWCWADARCSNNNNNNNALKQRIQGDCIYLTMNNTKIVRSYSLRHNECTSLLPHPNFLWYPDSPTWFMPHPNYSRLLLGQEENTENNGMTTRHVEETTEENAENNGMTKRHVEETTDDMDMDMDTSRFNMLSELPSDITISITKRMHLFDQLNLRLTCKAIRSIIPVSKWREASSYPLFMSFKNKLGICELWDPFETNSYRTYAIKTPYSSSDDDMIMVEFCRDGWLLLRIGRKSLEFFNPFTNERMECPSSRTMNGNSSHAFSTHPKNFDCLTLGIDGLSSGTEISCFQAGTEKWEYKWFEDVGFHPSWCSSPIWFNGAFCFIGEEGELGIFKVADEEWKWEVFENPLTDKEACESLHSSYLVELDGQLTSILFQDDGITVQLFTFDIIEKKWAELDDLGDNVLFLSQALSFSMVERDSIKRNRIYLPKCVGSNIVYYSLDTNEYHTLGKHDSMDHFYGMTTPFFCSWV